MSITDIYLQYKILPFLQLHQLRVAAVAVQICRSLSVDVDANSAMVASLLHDMGNILKFDFQAYPSAFEPEGISYWKRVQDEYRAKYGDDEHDATLAIARELGVSDVVLGVISAVGFRNVAANLADPSMEKKICCYADQRVGPLGVLSITERLQEGARRYARHPDPKRNASHFDRSGEDLYALERQIFAQSSIGPNDISNGSISGAIVTMKTITI